MPTSVALRARVVGLIAVDMSRTLGYMSGYMSRADWGDGVGVGVVGREHGSGRGDVGGGVEMSPMK